MKKLLVLFLIGSPLVTNAMEKVEPSEKKAASGSTGFEKEFLAMLRKQETKTTKIVPKTSSTEDALYKYIEEVERNKGQKSKL